MELGLTSADSCHEVSVHPTLCDEFLEMECRLLWSELANVVGSLRHQSLPFFSHTDQTRTRICCVIHQLRQY